MLSAKKCAECENLCRKRAALEAEIHRYAEEEKEEVFIRCMRFCLSICREVSTDLWKR